MAESCGAAASPDVQDVFIDDDIFIDEAAEVAAASPSHAHHRHACMGAGVSTNSPGRTQAYPEPAFVKRARSDPLFEAAVYGNIDTNFRVCCTSWAQAEELLGHELAREVRTAVGKVFSDGDESHATEQATQILHESFPEFEGLELALCFANLVADALELRSQSDAEGWDFVEGFCGTAAVTRSALARGWKAKCFDIRYALDHDILSALGFRRYVLSARSTKRGGTSWYAPVCSSWGFLCRKQSMRTKENPLGNLSVPWVLQGNNQLIRVTLVCLLLHLLGMEFVVESSMSSLITHVRYFRALMLLSGAYQHTCWLGHFGAPSPKPVKLMTTAPWVAKVKSKRRGSLRLCTNMVKKGKVCINGIKVKLQESEFYPLKFGEALCQARLEHRSGQQL